MEQMGRFIRYGLRCCTCLHPAHHIDVEQTGAAVWDLSEISGVCGISSLKRQVARSQISNRKGRQCIEAFLREGHTLDEMKAEQGLSPNDDKE